MEYYSVIKKKEILAFKTIWMVLKDTMLSEINQTEEEKHCMISLICRIKTKHGGLPWWRSG